MARQFSKQAQGKRGFQLPTRTWPAKFYGLQIPHDALESESEFVGLKKIIKVHFWHFIQTNSTHHGELGALAGIHTKSRGRFDRFLTQSGHK